MTAIEWLYEQLNGLNKPILDEYFQTVFSKAKEMEKKQLEKVFKDAFVYGLDWNQKEISFDEYYNETFKQL